MHEAFDVPRDPRSPEYKAGVRAALEFRLNRQPTTCPYLAGTARADAFLAGLDEGHRIASRVQQSHD
jgi:hypothetical protein